MGTTEQHLEKKENMILLCDDLQRELYGVKACIHLGTADNMIRLAPCLSCTRGHANSSPYSVDCRMSFNKGGPLPNMKRQFRFYAHAMWGRKLAYVPEADKPKSRPNLRRCVHCRHKEIMQQTEVHHLMIMCCQTTILIMPDSCF